MHRLTLIFLIAMLALGGAAIAWADGPPPLPSDVTCTTATGQATNSMPTDAGTGAMTCFYPAHDK